MFEGDKMETDELDNVVIKTCFTVTKDFKDKIDEELALRRKETGFRAPMARLIVEGLELLLRVKRGR